MEDYIVFLILLCAAVTLWFFFAKERRTWVAKELQSLVGYFAIGFLAVTFGTIDYLVGDLPEGFDINVFGILRKASGAFWSFIKIFVFLSSIRFTFLCLRHRSEIAGFLQKRFRRS